MPLQILLLLALLATAAAQAARSNGDGNLNLDPVEPGEPRFERREDAPCNPHFRSIDGICTNPAHKLWGAAAMPHYSYRETASSVTPTGDHLPSARFISNVLCRQSGDQLNRRGLSELVTFFGQFLDHNIVATPVSKDDPMPIPIPEDDPVFANFSGFLPFQRSVRGKVSDDIPEERAINTLSSALDLAAVYGSDPARTTALRRFKNGEMQHSSGNMLQVNDEGLRNAPTNEPLFYLSGDHRANEHPVLTSFHTLFMREHNKLCNELKHAFPHWDDETLFTVARKINGGIFQKIVYTEFIPVMTGRRLRRYEGFKPWVNPTVSNIFSTAAFRVGHTMVGNGINRRDKKMKEMDGLQMQEMFFRPRDVMKGGIEPFLRGAIYNAAQEVDIQIHDSLRNFLFTGIPDEKGFDLISLNLQRGRDHALPSYNEVRSMFGLPKVKHFSQITRVRSVQSALATAYQSVDRVEAWVGLVAEDHVRGASMGRTMLRVWGAEFTRLRDGDAFFYRKWNQFPYELFRRLPHIRRLLYGPESLREIILRNTDITEEEIGASVWKISGDGKLGKLRGRGRGRRGRERRKEKHRE